MDIIYNDYERLGGPYEGSYASVYKVRHIKYGYVRALKVLKDSIISEDDKKYQTFLKECKMLLKIGNGSHPNIVRIYQPRLINNQAMVEMDYINGIELQMYLEKTKFMPIAEVFKFISQIGGALAYCHRDIYLDQMDWDADDLERDPRDGCSPLIDAAKESELVQKYRVIYNDLHSRNVMRRHYDGNFILLDFDLAIQNGTAVKSSSLREGAPEYKSPEKWNGADVETPQNDIYSFGVLLYEVLTGLPPFPMDSQVFITQPVKAIVDIMNKHLHKSPAPIEPMRKAAFEAAHPGEVWMRDYPVWLEQMVMKCLAKKPSDRYADAKELIEDFNRHMAKDEADQNTAQRETPYSQQPIAARRPLSSLQSLGAGTLLKNGDYIIKEVIDCGGFGITYLARQVHLNRDVAIKEFFMHRHCMRDNNTGHVMVPPTGNAIQVEMYKRKFHKEACTLASLNHPNIVSVIELWEENETVYYSMPYLPGGSLKQLVIRDGRLDETTALRYVKQVAEALKYMHQKHLCHYDVKPANILLDSKNNAILIDFGISKNYDERGNETSNTPIGVSDGFAPIEQYNNITTFSPASDVYSLGATFYFLLTGDVPPCAVDLVQETSTLQFRVNVSSRTKTLIETTMAAAAKNRPQNVDSFLQHQIVANKPEPKTDREKTRTDPIAVRRPLLSPQQQPRKPAVKTRSKKWPIYIILPVLALATITYLASTGGNGGELTSDNPVADSFFQVGRNYYKGESGYPQDYSQAAKLFLQAAELGDATAQSWLGDCYEFGEGVGRDYSEAVKWYRKAADQGEASAQDNLGDCYWWGHGVNQSYKEAVKWYRKAADQNHARGQYNLGYCYEYGMGVTTTPNEAIHWYRKAAAQGNTNAKEALKRLGQYVPEAKD